MMKLLALAILLHCLTVPSRVLSDQGQTLSTVSYASLPAASVRAPIRSCTVSFQFNAFIPKRLGGKLRGQKGTWFKAVSLPRTSGLVTFYGNTDNRGFGGGSSKLTIRGSFPIAKIGRLTKRKSLDIGTRFRVSRASLTGYPLRLHAIANFGIFPLVILWILIAGSFSVSTGVSKVAVGNRLISKVQRLGRGKIIKKSISVRNSRRRRSRVAFSVAVENAMKLIPEFANPDINVEIVVSLSKSASKRRTRAQLKISGKTDAFPDYECIVNGKLLFARKTKFKSARSGITQGLPGGANVRIGSRKISFSC